MTLEELLEWIDVMRPSAYTSAQKTVWINDLEAIIWTQIFLQPAGQWRAYRLGKDGKRRLLLPESWRRVYTAYLGAMIDFANGEYTQYENGMSLYNGYICELGAWYADTFEPAGNPARWTRLGTAAYTGLQTDQGQLIGAVSQSYGVLALEWRVTEPLDGNGTIMLLGYDDMPMDRLTVQAEKTGTYRSLGLLLPDGASETVRAVYRGESLERGQLELWALVQPCAGGKYNKY